jgi:5-formyltetrahydrofolate cyclo-ligase
VTVASDNRQLRRRFRAARRALGLGEQITHGESVARAVAGRGLLLKARVCGAYFSRADDGELDTCPLLARLWAAGKTVGCPVIGADGVMDLYRVEPATPLTANRFGIPEPRTRGKGAVRHINPRTLSVLFVPLVAFDDHGSRLGMGAGYYDRYLGGIPTSLRPLVVGLAHEVQRSTTQLPRQPWDVPLDAVVTESGWRAFSTRAKV